MALKSCFQLWKRHGQVYIGQQVSAPKYKKRGIAMLDLRRMTNEDFSVPVMPAAPTSARLFVTVNREGKIHLCEKLAAVFAKRPVKVSFNPQASAIQIAVAEGERDAYMVAFPKNGTRKFDGVVELLKKNGISVPARYESLCGVENNVWRGAVTVNPTMKLSEDGRSTKKK